MNPSITKRGGVYFRIGAETDSVPDSNHTLTLQVRTSRRVRGRIAYTEPLPLRRALFAPSPTLPLEGYR